MKKSIYILGLSLFFLTACLNGSGGASTSTSGGGKDSSGGSGQSDTSGTSDSGSDTSSSEEPETNPEIKDGPILHAWDWSTSMVKNALPDIKKAGYKNVQLSPMQPSKNTNSNAEWWNLYQPQGFKIATGYENPIGNKDSLKELTKAANEQGINIIMDVVTNHLGGNANSFDNGVRNFEQKIYDDDLMHHEGQIGDHEYGNRSRVIRGAIGLPDLKTENSYVQERVISMVKEYIDCGVKGFRFDAAKHIETDEDDNDYKSDFWKNVTGTIYTYGEQKLGVTPFVYGEVLDYPAIRYEAYTKYMSVTDNRQSEEILHGVRDGKVDKAASTGYKTEDASKTVLWAESHDTFENESQKTTNISKDILNLTYAIQISRKDATALFFARPSENYQINKAPQVISGASDDYKSPLISAANKFHNDFVGGSETISISNSAVVNIRKTSRNQGALIADVNRTSSNMKVSVPELSNGEYTDLITNKKYNVVDGEVTVQLTNGGCILEKDSSPTPAGPAISITADDITFADKTNVRIRVTNGNNSTYKINEGTPVAFNESVVVPVGQGLAEGEIKITVNSSNSSGNSTKSITIYKSNLDNKNFVVINVPSDVKLGVWSWNDGEQGSWTELVGTDSKRGADIAKPNYLIGKFETSVTDLSWSNCLKKTNNNTRSSKVELDYEGLTFVNP